MKKLLFSLFLATTLVLGLTSCNIEPETDAPVMTNAFFIRDISNEQSVSIENESHLTQLYTDTTYLFVTDITDTDRDLTTLTITEGYESVDFKILQQYESAYYYVSFNFKEKTTIGNHTFTCYAKDASGNTSNKCTVTFNIVEKPSE